MYVLSPVLQGQLSHLGQQTHTKENSKLMAHVSGLTMEPLGLSVTISSEPLGVVGY
jgi:hypothetical protein